MDGAEGRGEGILQPGDPLNALPPLGAAGDDERVGGGGLAGRGARGEGQGQEDQRQGQQW